VRVIVLVRTGSDSGQSADDLGTILSIGGMSTAAAAAPFPKLIKPVLLELCRWDSCRHASPEMTDGGSLRHRSIP